MCNSEEQFNIMSSFVHKQHGSEEGSGSLSILPVGSRKAAPLSHLRSKARTWEVGVRQETLNVKTTRRAMAQ